MLHHFSLVRGAYLLVQVWVFRHSLILVWVAAILDETVYHLAVHSLNFNNIETCAVGRSLVSEYVLHPSFKPFTVGSHLVRRGRCHLVLLVQADSLPVAVVNLPGVKIQCDLMAS